MLVDGLTHHLLFYQLLSTATLVGLPLHAGDPSEFANPSDVHLLYGLSSLFAAHI